MSTSASASAAPSQAPEAADPVVVVEQDMTLKKFNELRGILSKRAQRNKLRIPILTRQIQDRSEEITALRSHLENLKAKKSSVKLTHM